MVPSGHRPMEAVVIRVEAPDRVGYVEEGEGFLDVVIDHFSSERWDLELEVTTPEGERFTHTGRHRVANRLGGLRRMFTRWRPVPGLAVPVLVSADRSDLTIDWDAFVARGSITEAARLSEQFAAERAAQQSIDAMGRMLAKQPKQAAKARDLALRLGPEMADEVTTGVRPAEEFHRWIAGLVAGGALTSEEGAELLERAGIR